MSREPSPAPIEAVPSPTLSRSNRPSRACTLRAAERLKAAAAAASEPRRAKSSSSKRKRNRASENGDRGDEDGEEEEEEEDAEDCDGEDSSAQQCGKIVTSLVAPPPEAQLPRWNLRSMWELASVLNFLHVFRHLLNISAEFSAEEFETALITPNDNLSDIHIPLLKAIPPVTRMALTRDTWVTVLCRKLRDWWHWVADGDLPIVAAHGAEIEAYKTLDPGVRVVILKALCDIRVEQEDIRNYIDNSLKHGVRLSTFRKERVGGDSHGISYWYEDDSLVGHRLYREIRKFEMKRAKTKGSNVPLGATYQWETVATNFDEFEDVSEKLFTSKNRTEASLGKKLKNDMLPEIEKVHKRKEKLLKKQHRQALLLDNFYPVDGIGPGRSLRDRKPVTYTFDDYDRSINEAIKITKKKPPSPESLYRRDDLGKPEASSNGKWSPSYAENNFSALSPKSPDYNEADDEDADADADDDDDESLDRGSNRRRQRPQRYSEKDFVEAISDNDADFDSDDEIVGEAIYDEEYLRKRKQRRKLSSSSEGDEEYHWDDENAEEEEEEEDEEEEFLSGSDDSDESPKFKKLRGSSTRRGTKLRSVGDLQSGLRRSKRSTRNRINYQQYEISDSEGEAKKLKKSNALEENSDESDNEIEDEHENENENENGNGGFLMESPVSDANEDDTQEIPVGQSAAEYPVTVEKVESTLPPEKLNSPGQEEIDGVRERRFLDLNEIAPGDLNEAAPGSSFDDAQNNAVMKDDDTDEF